MSKLKNYGPYLVFLAAMFWATDAPFRVHLTHELSSSFIVLSEHFFDTLIILPILIMNFKEVKALRLKQWLAVIVIAIGGSALASVAFTQAFHYVNPSVAILLQKLQPLIAISLAYSLLGERLKKNYWIWAIVALAGAYLISFPGLRPQLYSGEQFNPNLIGVSLALIAAVLWGASTVLGKYVLDKASFKTMTSLRFVVAFLFLILLNFWQKSYPNFAKITGTDYLFMLIIALASGVFSLFIYYYGLQTTRASVATIAELGFPLAAVVVNAIFLKDALVPMQVVGMAVLLLGVYFLSGINDAIRARNNKEGGAHVEYAQNPID
ncbi:DMT family transporter [Patescibacteria group bacterium]|nr:DMT family transporter [Patescibacteria group bacterium]